MTIDDLPKIMAAEIRAGENAVKRAVTQAGRGVQEGWRAQIRSAGLGNRLPRTIRSRAYPQGKGSLNAAAMVWSRAPEIIGAFDAGAQIQSRDGLFLAIPTPEAGMRGVGRSRITPAGFEQRTGLRLRFIYRSPGPSLLVADGARINARGRAVMSRAKVRESGLQKGAVTAVIFWLVPQVTIRKRLDLARDAERWGARLPDLIVANWRDW